ncbi:MAG: efflux RND transporter permease subunit [Pseudomonadota bacterium]
MHRLTAWFLRNPVAANLSAALIVFLGVLATTHIRIEGFPRVPPESIVVSVNMPGATADQVDRLVTQEIERALEGLEGVRSISAQSLDGTAVVTVRRAGGHALQDVLDKVSLRVDGIADLPKEAERPVLQTDGFDFPALYVNVFGDIDAESLRLIAADVKAELLAQPELSRLKVWGIVPQELRVDIDPVKLRRLNLTVSDIHTAIQSNSLDAKAGALRTAGGTVFLRADDQALYAPDLASLPIIERTDGTVLSLGDVATVSERPVEGDYFFRFNNLPTVGMEVLVGQNENLLRISDVVNRVAESFRHRLPPGIDIAVWGDSAGYIADRLNLLKTNGLQGLALVLLILSIFLSVRLAFFVALGIPIAIMGALVVSATKWVDYSLNDVTTFGLIIVLGILVDDAVVVGESVFEARRTNRNAITGTEAGVKRVSVATVFGVLTTIAAFFPMLLIDNPLGKALAGFSGIVILALIFSLIESKLILPAHLAAVDLESRNTSALSRAWAAVQHNARLVLSAFRDRVYAPVLRQALMHRYAVLVLFLAAGVFGIGLIAQGKVKTVFFPDVPGNIITVNLEMDARAPFALTSHNIEQIRTLGETLNRELADTAQLDQPPIRALFVIVDSATTAQIVAELTPIAERPGVEILHMVKQWRERTGQLEGVAELQFTGSESVAGGFAVQLYAKDRDRLRQTSAELRAFLADIEGVHNVRDDLAGGQPELRLTLKPEAGALGFTAESLAQQIGLAYGGTRVQTVRRHNAELNVIVQHAADARDTVSDLLSAELKSAQGAWVPLTHVVKIEGRYVTGARYRFNGKQVNTVAATIDRAVVAPEEVGQAITEQLVPKLRSQYPGVEIKLSGELEEIGDIQDGLKRALWLATALIYVLMAIPLKSYWQPFVILAIVPFGFVGAAIGHSLLNVPLSILSFFGMLALAGVVVNDSLVLITRYNQARAAGSARHDALIEAGVSRFQAIFLTTATTVAGLLPLLNETSEQAQYLIPAAISLAYGELFATVLMLILVPVLIAIGSDVSSAWRWLTTGQSTPNQSRKVASVPRAQSAVNQRSNTDATGSSSAGAP